MSVAVRLPDPKVRLTLAQLAQMQKGAARHLTFNLTLACPLRCAHCIVDAGPDKGSTTMPIEVARRYAGQMADLAAYGIRAISFTGGEPLLARDQLQVMSDAAGAAGLTSGVVTAAHWAYDETSAAKIVGRYPGIQIWDISTDIYHTPFVAKENVSRAYEAARRLGRTATIRFTYHDPPTEEDERMLSWVGTFADPEDVCSQRVRKVGRGLDLGLGDSEKYHPWNKPCITQGLVVRYDGSVAPCCVNLVEERRHPFDVGDPRLRLLSDVHRDYMSLPLLQMIRVVGFLDVVRWVQDADLEAELRRPLPDDVCDLCPQLLTNDRVAAYLVNRAGAPENRLRIAVLASRLLDEHALLRRTIEELGAHAGEIEGFADAAALLQSLDDPGNGNP